MSIKKPIKSKSDNEKKEGKKATKKYLKRNGKQQARP